MAPPLPDLVRVSRLETPTELGSHRTQHIQYVTGSTSRQRRIRKEEIWSRERGLGGGAFGVVWLERCTEGERKGELRAVKQIQKLESSGEYYRELEAIALFSHDKACLNYRSPPHIYRAKGDSVRAMLRQIIRLV